MNTVGHVSGRLKIVIDDAELDIGSVRLPLAVTRVSPEKSPYMHLGIGVDLEEVRDTVEEIFKSAERAGSND